MRTLPLLLALAACTAPPPRHVGVLIDLSDSLTAAGDACLRGVGAVADAIASRELDPRSQLVVYATSDGTTAARRLLPPTPIPVPRGGLHGRSVDAERAALVGQVAEACRASQHPIGTTPLRAALEVSLAGLRALGCDAAAPCVLHVASDLVETVDPVVSAHVAARPPRTLPKLPSIAAAGVEVIACGWSDSAALAPRASGSDERRARVEAVWAEVLAGETALRTVPHCAAPPAPAVVASPPR